MFLPKFCNKIEFFTPFYTRSLRLIEKKAIRFKLG